MTWERPDTTYPSHDLKTLIELAHQHLEELGYAPTTCSQYRGVWRRLTQFSKGKSFSEDLVRHFLVREGFPADALEDASGADPNRLYVISALHVLAQYISRGFVRAHRHSRRPELPDELLQTLLDYEVHCITFQRQTRRAIHSRKFIACKFLCFFKEYKEPLQRLEPSHISRFIASQSHLKPMTLKGIARDLRSFFRFLWKTGTLDTDLSKVVPKVRIARGACIPTVWPTEDVNAILSAIDRASPKGKRDYAIFLLAARLALRSADILSLCLENLRWTESRITLNQSKTGRLLELPLLDEVGQALIDYLRYARPQTQYREVFLRLMAPFEPLSSNAALYHIFNVYRRRAGVTTPVHGHHGMHSLRHTLATRLLECETPLETISQVLGHASSESSLIYLKVGISALRTASLNPDLVVTKEV